MQSRSVKREVIWTGCALKITMLRIKIINVKIQALARKKIWGWMNSQGNCGKRGKAGKLGNHGNCEFESIN